MTDLDTQYLESSLCTVFKIHHIYSATLQRHVCILTVWLLHHVSCIQKWLIWFYAVCINHNQDTLCEHLVRWQLVSTLDVGHQQAVIQECVPVYVHILVSWPVDDPNLGSASCLLIKLFAVCVGCDGFISTDIIIVTPRGCFIWSVFTLVWFPDYGPLWTKTCRNIQRYVWNKIMHVVGFVLWISYWSCTGLTI